MTTVIAVYNSDGCVGRCDANCHNARLTACDCICGGRNHGCGRQQAIENNQQAVGLTAEDVERFATATTPTRSTFTTRSRCPPRKSAA
jgi:hypothetical protein